MNVSLWLKVKNNMFTEEEKNCEWIMNSNNYAQNDILADEKLFISKPHPNRQNS